MEREMELSSESYINSDGTIKFKRRLGNGHWDKKLKQNLVELSNADNYDDAKLEWIATGDVWWGGNGENRPSWVNDHAGSCLCGHRVVYHFKIQNTENGNEECVGSEHIGSYLILREIKERTGMAESEITDEMIQEWINTRTQSMIQTAWWDKNGEQFTQMFDRIKEADLRINVKSKFEYWCHQEQKYKIKAKLLKRGSGKIGEENYQMSSIVWRWNHPDNKKNQSTTRGYPNDKLWADLILFHFKYDLEHKARIERENARLEAATQRQIRINRDAEIRRLEERARREEMIRVREEQRRERERKKAEEEAERQLRMKELNDESHKRNIELLNSHDLLNAHELEAFKNGCDYYGIPIFDGNYPISFWESKFLVDIRRRLANGQTLSTAQLDTLKNVCSKDKATERQVDYLISLGYTGDTDVLTKRKASALIQDKHNYGNFEGER